MTCFIVAKLVATPAIALTLVYALATGGRAGADRHAVRGVADGLERLHPGRAYGRARCSCRLRNHGADVARDGDAANRDQPGTAVTAAAPRRASAHCTCSRTNALGRLIRPRSAAADSAVAGALPSPTARLRSQRS